MNTIASFVGRCLAGAARRLDKTPDHSIRAFSQEGEDLILHRIFADKKDGFYVDVGAHHPKRYSNTYLFYQKGWHGINIDAMPGSMAPFLRDRSRDINLEVAIACHSGEQRTFHVFDEQTLNTFDEALAISRIGGAYNHKIVCKLLVKTQRLEEVLASQGLKGKTIDFLTVDVEGLDLEVLQSNDWQRFRPSYVLAECYGVPLMELTKDEVAAYLASNGYAPFAKTVNTVIFRDVSHPV